MCVWRCVLYRAGRSQPAVMQSLDRCQRKCDRTHFGAAHVPRQGSTRMQMAQSEGCRRHVSSSEALDHEGRPRHSEMKRPCGAAPQEGSGIGLPKRDDSVWSASCRIAGSPVAGLRAGSDLGCPGVALQSVATHNDSTRLRARGQTNTGYCGDVADSAALPKMGGASRGYLFGQMVQPVQHLSLGRWRTDGGEHATPT